MPVRFVTIEEECAKRPELKKEDIATLKEWMSKQPHLPVISDLQAALFLNSCYFKMEATKTCVEKFYTLRTHCPEFFSNRDPFCKATEQQLRVILSLALPDRTPDNCAVYCMQFANTDPDLLHFTDALKVLDMSITLYNNVYGLPDGHILIFNSKGLQLAHVLKVNLLALKKALYYVQEALPIKLKEVHIINVSTITEKALGLVKPFVSKELYDMIHLHKDLKSLFKYVPKNMCPEEYGGSAGSVFDMLDESLKITEDCAEFFKQDELLKSDESKRLGKSTDYNNYFGAEGTFKKLSID